MRCKESEQFQSAVEEAATTLAERKRMATAADFEHAEILSEMKLSVHDTAAYMSIPAYLFLTHVCLIQKMAVASLDMSFGCERIEMADDDGNCGLGASGKCRVTLYKNRNKINHNKIKRKKKVNCKA